MLNRFRKNVLWQVAAGFVLGAAGLAAAHASPAHAQSAPIHHAR